MTLFSSALRASVWATGLLAAATLYAAPATTQGTAHFLVLDSTDMPLPGVQIAGACESRTGPFWNAEKHSARWSCTADSTGVCVATISTLAQADGKPVECRGTERSTITEKGASAAKISYHAFFPRGLPTSYTLLKKGASWKDGEYLFKSFPNQNSFESTALRYRSSYYAQRIETHADAPSQNAVLSTQAAHHQESADFQNMVYLTAQRSTAQGPAQWKVGIVLTYVDYTFHRYAQAAFDGASGKQTVALTALSDKTTCNLRDLMERKCTYRENLEFPLDAAFARQLAAKYQAGVPGNWALRISSPHGHVHELPVAYAEFAALVQALDAPAQR